MAPTSEPRRARRKRSLRGIIACLAMFALGGAVLWGLFLSPRSRSPASPAVPWGTPLTPLRFISLDLAGGAGVDPGLLDQVRALSPDYALVQNIRFNDVLPLAEALGMAPTYHPQLFQRDDPRSKASPGDLILSKHPLYDAARVVLDPDPRAIDDSGVQAVSVVDGVRFVVASGVGATGFDAARKGTRSAPPTVLATGFAGHTGGEAASWGQLQPAVTLRGEPGPEGPALPVAGIYSDPSWAVGVTEPRSRLATSPTILYAELKGQPPSARPATRPAPEPATGPIG